MDNRVIRALLEAIIPEVKEHSNNLVAPIKGDVEKILARIEAVEGRQPERGEKGDPGENGHRGVDGKDGLPGKDGVDGLPGKNGADGRDGKDGADGVAGKDGADGLNGRDGVDGLHGKDGADGLSGRDGLDAPAPTIEQITEAVKALDADLIIRRALTGESRKDGIDVLAPEDVAQEMRSAVLLLAEPAPVKKAVEVVAPATVTTKPRTFRFDRDAQNRIIAAHEEFEDAQ